LLDRERAIELCEAGLDFIYFSVDGADKETYEKIRVGANFEQVIENISGMLEVAKEYRPELRTMFNFVIQPENLSQIPDIAELAAGLGINGITYSYAQEPDIDDLNPFGAKVLNEAFTEARSRVAGKNLFMGTPPVREVAGAHCCFLECVCLLRDGRVLPCHAMAPGYCPPERSRSFGSLTEYSLSEIWNSQEFTKFRDDVLHERYPANCQGCYCLKYLVP
jgi:radical SAM protein with 4Fe4S-binding SPASM domain